MILPELQENILFGEPYDEVRYKKGASEIHIPPLSYRMNVPCSPGPVGT